MEISNSGTLTCELIYGSDASLLLDAANDLKHHRGLVIVHHPVSDTGLSRVGLGLKLRERPGLALRAVVEGWDLDRVIREVR